MLRKVVLWTVAVMLPAGLLAVVIAPSVASAIATKTGKGTYNCTKISGTITFNPPLTSSGNSKSETTTVKSTSSSCSGGSPAVTKATSNETRKITSKKKNANSCSSSDTTSQAVSQITYNNGAAASTLTGTASAGVSSNGHVQFTIKDATVTGSYPSSSADVTITLKQTAVSLEKACSSGSIKTLNIASGSDSNI